MDNGTSYAMFLLDENLHRMDDDDCSYNASGVAFRDNCSEKGYAETNDRRRNSCLYIFRQSWDASGEGTVPHRSVACLR